MKSHTDENRIRPDILTLAVYLSVILMMIYGIVSQIIFGDKGAFFSAGPFFIYAFFYMGVVLAAQKAVYVMVRLRARRSQYLNAQSNMQKTIRVLSISTVILGLLIIAGSYVIAVYLFGTPRGFFQLAIAGAAVIFLGGQGVVRGYLQGIGYTRPIFMSDLIISAVSFVTGIIAILILYRYGLKVNDLFHVDEFSAVYGSCGMMVGIFFGALAGFIQNLVSFNIRKTEINEFVKSGAPKYLDNQNDVIAGIRPHLLLYISLPLMALIDQVFYVLFTMKKHEDYDFITSFGLYSGRILTTVIVLSIVGCMFFVKKWNRVMARYERDELEGARQRYKNTLRFFNMLLLPISAFTLAAPGTVLGLFFGKSSEIADHLMIPGAIAVYFLAAAIMHSWLISHMGKSVVIIVNTAIAFGVHIISLVLFVIVFDLGVMGLAISSLISFVVYDTLSQMMILSILKVKLNWKMALLKPLLAAVVPGILVFFVNRLLVSVIGEVLTFILCLVIYWFLFMVIMIATRGVRYHELSRIPFGVFFKNISRMIGNYEEG